MNPEMSAWLQSRHSERVQRNEAYVTALEEYYGVDAKDGRGKSRGQSRGGKEGSASASAGLKASKSDPGGLSARRSRKSSLAEGVLPVTTNLFRAKAYKSAANFMSVHFPSFDAKDGDGLSAGRGPMREAQEEECSRIKEVMKVANVSISDTTLERALLIPQDRPQAICVEGLLEDQEGLMQNPLPRELWRTAGVVGERKGKKARRRRRSGKRS